MSRNQKAILLTFDLGTLLSLSTLGFYMFDPDNGQAYIGSCIVMFSVVLFMLRYRLYTRLWKYSSIGELVSIFKAISLGSLLAMLLFDAIEREIADPRMFMFIYQSSLIIIGGSRFVLRLSKDNYRKKGTGQFKVLIIGAGDCGSMVAKEIMQNKYITNSYPVGFIDDDIRKFNSHIAGLRVLGDRSAIQDVVKRCEVDHIIISMPSASRKTISEIVTICKETHCQLKIVPKLGDIIEGKVTVSHIRDVEVQDLLGRSPATIDLAGIANYVEDKVVLVTGAGGSIGSELCRQIAPFKPSKLILLGHGENSIYQIDIELEKKFPNLIRQPIIADVKVREEIMTIFDRYKPDVVFHAAAYKHVPLMEQNRKKAYANNIIGTKNVAEASDRYNVDRFVLISTDKAVNPISVMGASKRMAEIIVQSIGSRSATKFSAVRFGNVLGSRGSVIPRFKAQIAEGGPVTVTHPEMIRYFMTIPEASQLVVQAGAYTKNGEIFILDMGEPMNIHTLAKDLIRLSGLEPNRDIDIQFTGLRPGEKLFEELFTNDEELGSTKNNRIFIGTPLVREADVLMNEMNDLESIMQVDLSEVKAFIIDLLNSTSTIRMYKQQA